MKRMIGIAGVAMLLWNGIAAAKLVSLDINFPQIKFDKPVSAVTYRLSYDTAAKDTDPDPNVGVYAATLVFIADGIAAAPFGVNLQLSNANPGDFDAFGIQNTSFPLPFPIVNGHPMHDTTLQIGGIDMLSNTALPDSAAFANGAQVAFLLLQRADTDTPNSDNFFPPNEFDVVNTAPVPEPASWLAVVVGIGFVVAARGARRIL